MLAQEAREAKATRELVVRSFADDLMVPVEFTCRSPRDSWCDVRVKERRAIRIGVAREMDTVGYWTAMHELGHAHVARDYPLTNADFQLNRPANRENEAAAWQWALDNSPEEPDDAAWRCMFAALSSYWMPTGNGPLFTEVWERMAREAEGVASWGRWQ